MIVHFLRMIRFSHTVFALPFALAALAVIAARYSKLVVLTWQKGLLVVAAFTAMRSFAMAVNRYADRKIDALNPRTAQREIPAGILSPRAVLVFALISLLILTVCAWLLSPLAGYLALPAAVLVATYSIAKRFTALCHFWLGLAIGMAPSAVYIALLQHVYPEALLMSGALAFYIAGFDILYALQDREFDREAGLYSIPARYGETAALWISRLSHLLSLVLVYLVLQQLGLNLAGLIGLSLLAALLGAEHWLVGTADNIRYEKIPIAFFNVNSIFSISFLCVICAALWL
ncbi:MAG: putative 4-hydroxybenzoate polyprenyltransferase [Turneriella sp.]